MPDMAAAHVSPMDRDAPIPPNVKPLELSEADFLEWVKTCKRGLGGSAMPALLGVSRFNTPLDVWRGFFNVAKARVQTYPMERGIFLEPVAAGWFTRNVHELSAYPGGFFRHPDERFRSLVGHPDGIIAPKESRGGTPGLWECKVPLSDGFNDAVELGVSGENMVQVQTYLEITGLDWGQFCIFDPGAWRGHIPEFERDAALIDNIKDAYQQFWNRHILTREPPDDIQEIIRRVAIPTVGDTATVLREHEHLKILDRYVEAHRTWKMAERIATAAGERMRDLMEELGSDFAVDRTGKKIYYREVVSRKIDVTLLRERFPEIAAQVEVEQRTRPLKAFYR